MAIAGYQNPLDFQMRTFSEKEEDIIEPVAAPSPFAPAADTTRSSLGILESAGIRSASDVLKAPGTPTTAKDVLRSTYFERPQGILESEGISAASVLEGYRKEQEKEKRQAGLMRVEQELQRREQEYIKNFKYEQPQFNPYKFDGTKFGDLDFKDADFRTDWGWRDRETGKATYYTYKIIKGDEAYVFMPEDFALKGARGENGDYFNTAFLNTETWETLLDKSQAIDASSFANTNFKDRVLNKDNFTELGRGFLFKQSDWLDFKNNYLDGKFFKEGTHNNGYLDRSDIRIQGIANVNGKLVYVKNNVQDGRTSIYDVFVDETGNTSYQWYKEKGGLLGDIARGFASIPFGPEIAFIASGGNPAVYASFKALETAGKGGKVGDVLKAGATAYVSASVGNSVGEYGKALGSSIATTTGMNAAVANTIGTAVVQAGFNGFMAAATGQDVGDAMLSGAIGGGIGANAASITNTVFGGAENTASLAKTLKLSTGQFQTIFAGSLAAGSINAAVHGKDFLDAFKESLIVNGVSQASANIVASNLDKTMDAKKRAAIVSNTRIFVQASARAAVRGEDINTAMQRVAPYLVGRTVGQTLDIATTKK
jgi:hypothetical protein